MKNELKQEWISALRSGEYQQTQGCLKNTKGYCCLGVLAELQGFLTPDTFASYIQAEDGNKHSATFPACALSKVDLHPGYAHVLMGMNDGGKSFACIAEFLESNPV